MATKSKNKVAKKSSIKTTFQPVHDECPELVNLFDYMIDQNGNGSQGVRLSDVEQYVENMSETVFGPNAVLAQFEHLQELHDLGY
jgi:hypothetical protein